MLDAAQPLRNDGPFLGVANERGQVSEHVLSLLAITLVCRRQEVQESVGDALQGPPGGLETQERALLQVLHTLIDADIV